MYTITLNDGVTIPQLGFGVADVASTKIEPTVAKALEVGYRHIDTAAIYRNEEGVGRAIARSGIPRAELFVTTKLWRDRHDRAGQGVRESLDRLGLDHVDLFLVHWPVPSRDSYLQAWQGLEQAKQDGLTRSIGVSNFHRTQLDRLSAAGATVPSVNQVELHPTFAQKALSEENASRGIVTEAYSPLGLQHDLVEPAIVAVAKRTGRTPAQVILRWHLQQGRIAIPKSVTPARIAENFGVFDFELSVADIAAIDGTDRNNRIGGHPELSPAHA